jgi:hypothetical protein
MPNDNSRPALRLLSDNELIQRLLDCHQAIGDEVRYRMINGDCILAMVPRITSSVQPQTTPRQAAPVNAQRITDVRRIIEQMYDGTAGMNVAAEAVLHSGWNFTDPSNLTRESAEQIKNLLTDLTFSVGRYTDLPETSYKRLIRMAFDSYCRALRQEIMSAA